MVKLFCALVGIENSVFEVDIEETASVSALKAKIHELNDDIKVPPRDLKLFIAKRDKGRGEWLTEEEVMKGVSDLTDLELLTSMRLEIGNAGLSEAIVQVEMTTAEIAKLMGPVNVLALVPQRQTELWVISESIPNVLNTKGIRCRVYRLAASYLGYYDPDLRAGDIDKALWYKETKLQIHIVFKEGMNFLVMFMICTERGALLFENELHHEGITQTSPLEGHEASTEVAPMHREAKELRHILTRDYLPDETDSPQGTVTSVSINVSIVELETDEFKYQSIEKSCHLISKEQPTHHKYDIDQNNRLALSSEMHGWYDGSNVVVPVMNISVESVSDGPEIGSRYKVT
ncbi:hypothetical protein P3T76_014888 [Phytophthora citrophthora]|uniref:Crinkler effector protein N-terminal domain-containing protein n=1 Tax=Phytophthora citrophthora TaxID=4793 RepID=A0AAD9G0C0_9STRA|nr:hypothetical protein P3T76_014888 [Phytophthora citrophthora]